VSAADLWHDTTPLNELRPNIETYVRMAVEAYEEDDRSEAAVRVGWIINDLRHIMPRANQQALTAVARFMVEHTVNARQEAREELQGGTGEAAPMFDEDGIPPADLYKVEETGDGGGTWTLSGGVDSRLIDGESVTAHVRHWRGEHPELTVTGSADEITVHPRLFNGNDSRHGWRYTRQIRQEVTE
jgi:hypothetical protein